LNRFRLVPACTAASHEALRGDLVRLARETTPAGRQEDGAGDYLELRKCRNCGSTLAIEGTVTQWLYRATAPDGTLAYVATEEDAAAWCVEHAREASAWERVYLYENGKDREAVPLDSEEWMRIHTVVERRRAGGGPGWADGPGKTVALVALLLGAWATWGAACAGWGAL
jgi:hypothetical protein